MKYSKQLTRTPGDLLGDLQALVVEAERMLTGSLSDRSADAFRKLRTRFDLARAQFADTYAEARVSVTDGAKYTDDCIRANPYQSMAVAAGIGLLVGTLLGRRSV
jgi:ElaB/YqjD/DUF883 family membrane-anchored ribosome-binding protein